jgi:hypothetical protein
LRIIFSVLNNCPKINFFFYASSIKLQRFA